MHCQPSPRSALRLAVFPPSSPCMLPAPPLPAPCSLPAAGRAVAEPGRAEPSRCLLQQRGGRAGASRGAGGGAGRAGLRQQRPVPSCSVRAFALPPRYPAPAPHLLAPLTTVPCKPPTALHLSFTLLHPLALLTTVVCTLPHTAAAHPQSWDPVPLCTANHGVHRPFALLPLLLLQPYNTVAAPRPMKLSALLTMVSCTLLPYL